MSMNFSKILLLTCFMSSLARLGAQTDPAELVTEQSKLLNLQNWTVEMLDWDNAKEDRILIVGNQDSTTLPVTLMLSEKVAEHFQLMSNLDFRYEVGWKLLGQPDPENYMIRKDELYSQKKQIQKEVVDNRPGKSLVLTSVALAAEGCDIFGLGTLGSFLSVLGKSRNTQTINLGILSSESPDLDFLKTHLKGVEPSGNQALLINASELRKHVIAHHFSEQSNLFRVLVLKYRYLLIVPPSK